MRATRGIATNERTTVGRRQRVKAVGKRRQPWFTQVGQRQAQHAANRARAHGSQVGQIHRQRLVAQRFGINIGKEMPAFQQQIRAGGHLFTGRNRKQRAVVANT